ncbi:MAG: universal stress protein [Opitutales bacterium]|jgi:nucleotide-binding universal stress UspA family protein
MKRLLVCADGSAYSQVCCRYAAWLARRGGYAVEGVYVSDVWRYETSFLSDLGGSMGIQPYHDMLHQLEMLEEEKSKLIETALRSLFREEGVEQGFAFHHRTGSLTEAVKEFEEEPNAVSLLLMGKRGENANLSTEHLGSTMERVVRTSSKPCLVTPRQFSPVQRLLLAYDGSASATKALHWLVQAEAFKDLALHLVCVAGKDGGAATSRLQEGESILRAGGWKPVCQLLSGEPGDAIADYVSQQAISFLIMGAYGHSTIRRLIIGSTTTDLIRRCHIPVMLFR